MRKEYRGEGGHDQMLLINGLHFRSTMKEYEKLSSKAIEVVKSNSHCTVA
jgi:hypothetical protein